jgi:hypothetical protein
MHRFDFIACLALAAVVAGVVAIGRLAQLPDSDSLLFSIISLQHPTPYYWAQNRVGGLLPILFSPVRNIDTNFMLQTFCRALAAALTPAFLIVVLRPRMPLLLSFAASLGLLFLVMRDAALRSYWLDGSPYGLSLLFCTVAAWLVLARPPSSWRAAAALIAMAVASWVSIGIVVVAAPLFGILAAWRRSWSYAFLCAGSVGCFALETMHARRYGLTIYHTMVVSPYEQAAGLLGALQNSVSPAGLAIAALILLALLSAASRPRRAGAATLGLLLAACLVSVLVTAATTWFAINEHHPRYLSLPVTLAVGGLGIWIVQLLHAALGVRMRAVLTPAVTLAMVAACIHAMLPQGPLMLVPPAAEALAERAVRADVRLIAGDYWTAWPAVFAAIRQRKSEDTYGLTSRGEVMLDAVRASLAHDPRVLCVDPAPDSCVRLLAAFTGSPSWRGRPMADAMTAVETSAAPYSVLYQLR